MVWVPASCRAGLAVARESSIEGGVEDCDGECRHLQGEYITVGLWGIFRGRFLE